MRKLKAILIPGETIQQRKRSVQRLLRDLGYSIDLKQIRQERGELWIRWEPPFAQDLLQKMERFARLGTVYFVPHNTEPELEVIDLIFEREQGLLFYRPATMRSAVIVEAIERLPQLCAQYVEQMKQVEEARAQIRAHREQNPEPEQQELWGEE
jgi:hypothetical protein